MDQERGMRAFYAKLIFGLISFEVGCAFLLIFLNGLGYFEMDVGLLKILFPSVLAQVFGLGYLVTRYLFGKQLPLPLPENPKRQVGKRT